MSDIPTALTAIRAPSEQTAAPRPASIVEIHGRAREAIVANDEYIQALREKREEINGLIRQAIADRKAWVALLPRKPRARKVKP